MDTALTPVESLRPAFDRLRAAHLAHIPSQGERQAALERLERAVRACRDELVAACSADFRPPCAAGNAGRRRDGDARRDPPRAQGTCASGCGRSGAP
jgi:hypothetical protein